MPSKTDREPQISGYFDFVWRPPQHRAYCYTPACPFNTNDFIETSGIKKDPYESITESREPQSVTIFNCSADQSGYPPFLNRTELHTATCRLIDLQDEGEKK